MSVVVIQYTVHNIVKQATSNGTTTVNLCAIDLSKAFDNVNHNAVLIIKSL